MQLDSIGRLDLADLVCNWPGLFVQNISFTGDSCEAADLLVVKLILSLESRSSRLCCEKL